MVDLSTFPILVMVLTSDVLPSSQRTVEFYDTRVSSPLPPFLLYLLTHQQSCEEAASKLRHQSLGDGIMETEYGDAGGQPAPGPAMKR